MGIYKPLAIFQFSKRGLWTLFLMSAFPTHAWTILFILLDYSWISKRTNAWDAVGAGSYGLLFAFVESLAVFVAVYLLGFFVPRRWDENKRIALLSVAIFVEAFWAMIYQFYFINGSPLPANVLRFLIGSGHPARILYAITFAVMLPTFLVPIYGVMKSEKMVAFLKDLIDRLSLLTTLYLSLDVAGLLVVLLRNLRGS